MDQSAKIKGVQNYGFYSSLDKSINVCVGVCCYSYRSRGLYSNFHAIAATFWTHFWSMWEGSMQRRYSWTGCLHTWLKQFSWATYSASNGLTLIRLSQVVSDIHFFFELTLIVSGLFSSQWLIHDKMMLSVHSMLKSSFSQLAYLVIVIIVLIETVLKTVVVWNSQRLSRHFTTSSSVPSVLWYCWLGHLTRKNPSPIWPIMRLVGR